MTAPYSNHCTDPEIGSRIHEYQLNTLDDSTAARFEEHLFACAFCCAQLEQDSGLSEALSTHRELIKSELLREGQDFSSQYAALFKRKTSTKPLSNYMRRLAEWLHPPWVRYGLAPATGFALLLIVLSIAKRSEPPPVASIPVPTHTEPDIVEKQDSTLADSAITDTPPSNRDSLRTQELRERRVRALATTNVAVWGVTTLRGTEIHADSAEMRKAQAAYAARNFHDARRWLQDAVKLNPTNPETRFYLAMTSYMLKDYDDAWSELLLARKNAEPDSPVQDHIDWYLANIALGQGHASSADSILRVLASRPSDYQSEIERLIREIRLK